VSAIAVERPQGRYVEGIRRGTGRAALFVVVLGSLWGLWEGYRALWSHQGWTWPFVVDNTTMPHIHDIFAALGRPSQTGGPLLGTLLWHATLFTAKEAAVGFALGAVVGFALGVLLAHSKLAQRGLLPYVVASQTVPILAIAPIVVIYLGSLQVTAWVSVAVIAAYLTFFPVTISTLRGLTSADRRALELMRSYATGPWQVLWKLRVPSALPYIFTALKVSATASVVGAIIGEAPSSIQNGLGGEIVVFNQYYTLDPTKLWATNVVAALLGIIFFLVVVVAEKLVVRRAPEHVA
jgi:NitT/TauT family transport system permease protein